LGFAGDAARGLRAFTSVLIVACPCALALAAPFTLGTAQRLLARRQVFLKDGHSLERMAAVDCVVFDKTGTLTSPRETEVAFESTTPLSVAERYLVASLAAHSIHPHSVNILRWLGVEASPNGVEGFREVPGYGIEGKIGGALIRLGSAAWLGEGGIRVPVTPENCGVCLAIDRQFRGSFRVTHPLHPDAEGLLNRLNRQLRTILLSGDNERERERLAPLFGHATDVHFNQEPVQKLEFVRDLQASGREY